MGRLAVCISESEGCKVMHTWVNWISGECNWCTHRLWCNLEVSEDDFISVLWFPLQLETHLTACCVATREAKWISCLNIKLIMKGKSFLNLMLSLDCLQWLHSRLAAPAVPDSALPIGMEKEDGSTQLVPVEPSECIHLLPTVCHVPCCSGDAHILSKHYQEWRRVQRKVWLPLCMPTPSLVTSRKYLRKICLVK